jgi:hypothetical protein
LLFNRDVNKQLRDENDSLRAIIEKNKDKANTTPSTNVNKKLKFEKFIQNFYRLHEHQIVWFRQPVQRSVLIGRLRN